MEYLRFIFSSIVSLIINFLFSGSVKRKEFNNILIIRLDHIGDMVCTLQALYNLRKNYHNSQITLLTGSWNLPLFENNSLINELLEYNSPAFTRDKKKITGLKERFLLFRKLISHKYDLIIGFRDDLFTIALSLLLIPFKRVDRGTVRIKIKIQQLKKTFKIEQHEIEVNKQIITPVIKKFQGNDILFPFTEKELAWLNQFLEKNRLKQNNYAVIHPGASWEYKRWDYRNFQKIGAYLYSTFGLRSLIIGTKDELFIGNKIRENHESFFIDIVGRTELRQTVQIISEARIAICNDSAPMHIASQLGIPTIGLMSSADLEKFSPRGANVIYLHKKLKCHPCAQKVCVRPELPCINLIDIDEVRKSIFTLIGDKNE